MGLFERFISNRRLHTWGILVAVTTTTTIQFVYGIGAGGELQVPVVSEWMEIRNISTDFP